MNHPNQDQHKVPQVYLKQFGYIDANNQWKISVKKPGEAFTRQKSIKSFTAITNIFDIESYDPAVPRIFENLNSNLENGYHEIIADLDKKSQLSDMSYAFLLQLIANLIARSDHWRNIVLKLMNSPGKEGFLHFICGHQCKTIEEFKTISEQPFFKKLATKNSDKTLNRVMLYFMDYLMQRLWNYEIVIIQSQNGKPWWTSTNPVVAHNHIKGKEIFAKESEFYLPISPVYLAYFHFKGSDDQTNTFRLLPSNKIHLADDAQNVSLQNTILFNPSEYVIVAGEFNYRKQITTSSVLKNYT